MYSAAVSYLVGLTFFRRAKCIASLSSAEPFLEINLASTSAFLATADISRIRIADISCIMSSVEANAGMTSPFQRTMAEVGIWYNNLAIKSLPRESKRASNKSFKPSKPWSLIILPASFSTSVADLD